MQLKKKYNGNNYKLAFFLIIVISIISVFLSLSRILIPFGIAYIFTLMIQPLRRSMYSVPGSIRETFEVGDLIDHKKFGPGIVQNLVDLHDGKILASNRLDRDGAIVEIKFASI